MPPPRRPITDLRRLGAIAQRLERWFAAHQRELPWRGSYSPYLIWISEVMLQQTRMGVVLPYFARFVERFPSIGALASAEEQEVLAAWSGLGYYRRARMLHSAARTLVERFDGELPPDHAALMKIPGIGRYTAGAIGSIAFNQRQPIVDGNVARILSRLQQIEEPSDTTEFSKRVWTLSEDLVKSCGTPRVFNQALMEVGALICRPRDPLCQVCPVAGLCGARRSGAPESFPRAATRQTSRNLEIPLYIVRGSRGAILMRQERGKLMGDMFHLPHGNSLLLRSSRSRFLPGELLGSFRHTVTNRRIRFEVWTARPRGPVAGFRWIDPASLADFPHPSYVRKALTLFSG